MTDLTTLALAYCQAQLPSVMTTRALAVLGIICDEPGPHETAALAARMGVSKPVIVRITNSFEELSLAQRVQPPLDRRRCYLEPTALGRQFRDEIAALGRPSIAKAA